MSITKSATSITNLLSWFDGLEPAFRDDVELVSLMEQAMKVFTRIPNACTVQIGYQENRELVGLELMFSAHKCGLFTVRVSGSDAEYYEIDRSIERAAHSYKLKSYLFDTFKQQLKYRLEYIAKKLAVTGKTQKFVKRSRLSRMTNNVTLINKIENDRNSHPKVENIDPTLTSDIEKEHGMYNKTAAQHYLEQFKQRRPEADFPKPIVFDVTDLNGRVKVWSKKDLIRFYQKEIEKNPELEVDNIFSQKTIYIKKLKSNISPVSFNKSYSLFNPTPDLPFYVKNFQKPEKIKASIQNSWHIHQKIRNHKSSKSMDSSQLKPYNSPSPSEVLNHEPNHRCTSTQNLNTTTNIFDQYTSIHTTTVAGCSVFLPLRASRSKSLANFMKVSMFNKSKIGPRQSSIGSRNQSYRCDSSDAHHPR